MSVRISISLVCLLLLVSVVPAQAGSVDLNWMASAGASGYRVHYGPASGDYTQTFDAGNTTGTTIDGLDDCTKWHFAITAYNAIGESGFSNEVDSFRVIDVTPSLVKQGEQVQLTVTGAAFDDAAALLSVDNPNIRLENPNVTCGSIQVMATVEPTASGVRPAQIGRYTVSVTNPGETADKPDSFEVVINEARFDINRSDEATDGRLDGKDVVWLARIFGECDPDTHGAGLCLPTLYDPDYDFDGDGIVGGEDLGQLGSNFARCWNGSTWGACP